jgi:hypothetical protein
MTPKSFEDYSQAPAVNNMPGPRSTRTKIYYKWSDAELAGTAREQNLRSSDSRGHIVAGAERLRRPTETAADGYPNEWTGAPLRVSHRWGAVQFLAALMRIKAAVTRGQ